MHGADLDMILTGFMCVIACFVVWIPLFKSYWFQRVVGGCKYMTRQVDFWMKRVEIFNFGRTKEKKDIKKCYTKNKIDISLGFTHNSWIFASLKLR